MNINKSNHLTKLEKSLPAQWYFDEKFYNKELSKIWSNNWIYVCHKSRLEQKLSYLTISIGKQSIVILNDTKRKIKAYFNTCRHRGSVLCNQSNGKLKSKLLVCPYHQWSYFADTGELLQIASFSKLPKGFEKKKFSLFKVNVKEWRGCIFVNLDKNSNWNEETLFQRNPDVFKNFPIEEMVVSDVWEKIIDCNWKSFWENFNECLHCPNVHPELTSLVPMFSRRIINPQDLPGWMPKSKDSDPKFSGGLKKGAETWSENGHAQGCKINSLTESDLLKGHVYASSWPSIFIGGYADHVRIVRVSPIESEKVKISAEWLFEKKTLKNKSYNKENVISFACKIMEQDAKACELNQKGIHSIPYENGVLMPEEYVIKNFHDWLRKKLKLENGKGY